MGEHVISPSGEKRWFTCDCVEVEMGTYANSVALMPPAGLGITRVPVTVDRCIADEVAGLWRVGVLTTGNCCGHNKADPFISVAREEDVATMRRMGYKSHADRDDHFYPKSLRRRSPDGEYA